MKSFIVLALCVAAALAAPPSADPKYAETLRYDNTNIGVDGYDLYVETSDGTKRQEKAVLKNIGTENEALNVAGSYQYIGDDGQTYTVEYTADEFGFHPSGAHLPVGPA